MDNLMEKLNEKEKYRQGASNSWRPEPGEAVEGIVEKIGDTITEFGDQSYVELATGMGKVVVWLNSILQEQVDKEDVKRGDRIAVKFIGFKNTKKGNRKYKDYVLVKEG